MKSLSLNVPDEQAQAFAKELATLMKKHGVEVENKEALEDMRPITERVKTFEDACNELNRLAEKGNETAANLLADYESNSNNMLVKFNLAAMKLSIIAYALNEGWKPKFTEDEKRYYPWFNIYTQEDIDNIGEEERSHVLCCSRYSAISVAGVAYTHTGCDSFAFSTSRGGRLCFKNREIAKYAGQQFIAIYADFLIGF